MAALLTVENLRTYFYTRSGVVKAVDGVSFDVERSQTLGIVGESGSGKSVTMMSILGLIPSPPGKVVGGTAIFQGSNIIGLNEKTLRRLRGDRISMIFQDPMTSLNPYLKVSTQLIEVLLEHGICGKAKARTRAIETLEQVGIPDAASRVDQYPHQFSGGMRQRVMIAMAIISKPDLLIADEPTTALDVTIQAQILELLKQIQRESGMAMIFITHDLGVVAGVSDKLLVMYAGKPIEYGSTDEIFYRNHHPYTRGLLRSLPRVDRRETQLWSIPGLPPDPSRLPLGCAFAARCEQVMDICRTSIDIPVHNLSPSGIHKSVCHLQGEA